MVSDLLNFCKRFNRLFCFGAGRFGRELLVYLNEQGITIEAFLTSDHVAEGRKVLGVPLRNIQELSLSDNDGLILAVGKRFADEMQETLRKRGHKQFFHVDEKIIGELEQKTMFSEVFSTNQYVNVLFYHRIIDCKKDDWNICVSPEHFDDQMRWICDHYPIVRFGDDWSGISEPSVVITFDDGYADNYTNAMPILKKYGIPATFFISSACTHKEDVFWWDRLSEMADESGWSNLEQEHSRLKKLTFLERSRELSRVAGSESNYYARRGLTREELLKMAEEPLVDIGAHTKTHASLRLLSERQQDEEIHGAKSELESLLNKKVDLFSYPFGDFNAYSLESLKKVGFRKAATVAGGLAGTGNP